MNKFERKKFNIVQVLGIIILFVAIVSMFSGITLAWFMDESTTSNGEPNITLIGTLKLNVTTNFNFDNLTLAPDTIYETDANGNDIATYIKTATEHNIDGAYVRVKFSTTRREVGAVVDRDNSDLFGLYFESNLTTEVDYSDAVKNKWFYNSVDGYYYYIGGVYSTNVMFNKGYKTTNLMQNSNADATVTIDFVVESIQRQYGASAEVWTTAPSIFQSMATVESGTTLEVRDVNASIAIDGSTKNITLKTGQTLGDALKQAGETTITDSNSCGWFADEECTIPVSKDTMVNPNMKIYTKSATLDKLTFATSSDGKKTVSKVSSSITGDVVIPNDVQVIGDQAFYTSKITSIIIPNSVEKIGYVALHETQIKSLHIPASVTYIHPYVGSAGTLEKITVDAKNPNYTSGGGYEQLYYK